MDSNRNKMSKNITKIGGKVSAGAFNANNYKTKSDFQKRLMGENNLNKYKSIFQFINHFQLP